MNQSKYRRIASAPAMAMALVALLGLGLAAGVGRATHARQTWEYAVLVIKPIHIVDQPDFMSLAFADRGVIGGDNVASALDLPLNPNRAQVLNRLGEAGWELASQGLWPQNFSIDHAQSEYILKRPR
jgi:hypothetical protein